MTEPAPDAARPYVRYIDKTRAYYLSQGYEKPYAWANNASAPFTPLSKPLGAVAELVGIECGVVSGVFNLELSGIEVPDWRPRHDKHYHEA